jgi:hypothetical protein
MNPMLANMKLEQVRQRSREGDCPMTPALSTEWLEDLVLHFAPEPRTQPPADVAKLVEVYGQAERDTAHYAEDDRCSPERFAKYAAARDEAKARLLAALDSHPASRHPELAEALEKARGLKAKAELIEARHADPAHKLGWVVIYEVTDVWAEYRQAACAVTDCLLASSGSQPLTGR